MIDIENLSAEVSPVIDREIEKVLPKSGVDNLHDAIWYHMDTGGKKLRPLLSILACEALGGSRDKILSFAASCELLHNWLLIHDDIEDSDKVRRDKPAVWVKYGFAHGINIGDYMAHKVFELILHSKEHGVNEEKTVKLLQIMTDTALRTAEGQTMDINLRGNSAPTEKEYFDSVIGKTAHYLTVPMLGAAIVADREDLIPKLVEFGKNLGPAFQIADDILDLTEGKGRNEIGRDIKEGKRSILVVHCLGRCNPEEKGKLIAVLNKAPEETTEEDVAYVKGLFEMHGSIDYARRRAEEFTNEAKRIADSLPPKLKEILYFFTDYAIQRRK